MMWRTSSATNVMKFDEVLGLAGEALAQPPDSGRDTDRHVFRWHFRIMMQPAEINGAVRGRIVEAEEEPDHDVAARSQSPVDLHRDAAAQVVQHQGLVRLGEADLPGEARVLDRGDRARAGSAVVARDRDVVGVRLRDARGDRADAHLRDQLDADPRFDGLTFLRSKISCARSSIE